MKLNIDFIQNEQQFGRPKLMITDDRGEKLPGVRDIEIKHQRGDATFAIVTLVVNGKGVTLGREATPQAPGYFDCIKGGIING